MRVALFNAISTGTVSLIMFYFYVQHKKNCSDAFFKPWLVCEIFLCIMSIPFFYVEFENTKTQHEFMIKNAVILQYGPVADGLERKSIKNET